MQKMPGSWGTYASQNQGPVKAKPKKAAKKKRQPRKKKT